MYPEGLPCSIKTLPISSSMVTSQTLPRFNELCIRKKKQTKWLLINVYLLFYKRWPKRPPCSRTHKSVQREKRISEALEDSGYSL
jgi:hypothetical protein